MARSADRWARVAERSRAWPLFTLLFVQLLAVGWDGAAATRPSFTEWNDRCMAAPGNRQLAGRLPPTRSLPLRDFSELSGVIDDFFRLCQTGGLARSDAWLGSAPGAGFYDPSRAYFSHAAVPFTPFVQRLVVPPGSEVMLNGDLHGDVRSLLGRLRWLNAQGYLNGFQLTRTNAYLVFLGDYADRGLYGIEVFYTLLRLKLANPDRVFLGRGNHEDLKLAIDYGLIFEGQGKYGRQFEARRVARFFDFLPVALYVGTGTNFIQCSHAGVEPGFNAGPLLDAPRSVEFQLLGELRRKEFFDRHPDFRTLVMASRADHNSVFQNFIPASPTQPAPLGFLWTDFTIVPGETGFRIDPNRGAVYGQQTTRLWLQASAGTNAVLQGLVRAHQHSSELNPMMRRLVAGRGAFRHWQSLDSAELLRAPVSLLAGKLETNEVRRFPAGSVWTFNVSPDSVYGVGGKFDFDTFGILAVTSDFDGWRLRVVNPLP